MSNKNIPFSSPPGFINGSTTRGPNWYAESDEDNTETGISDNNSITGTKDPFSNELSDADIANSELPQEHDPTSTNAPNDAAPISAHSFFSRNRSPSQVPLRTVGGLPFVLPPFIKKTYDDQFGFHCTKLSDPKRFSFYCSLEGIPKDTSLYSLSRQILGVWETYDPKNTKLLFVQDEIVDENKSLKRTELTPALAQEYIPLLDSDDYFRFTIFAETALTRPGTLLRQWLRGTNHRINQSRVLDAKPTIVLWFQFSTSSTIHIENFINYLTDTFFPGINVQVFPKQIDLKTSRGTVTITPLVLEAADRHRTTIAEALLSTTNPLGANYKNLNPRSFNLYTNRDQAEKDIRAHKFFETNKHVFRLSIEGTLTPAFADFSDQVLNTTVKNTKIFKSLEIFATSVTASVYSGSQIVGRNAILSALQNISLPLVLSVPRYQDIVANSWNTTTSSTIQPPSTSTTRTNPYRSNTTPMQVSQTATPNYSSHQARPTMHHPSSHPPSNDPHDTNPTRHQTHHPVLPPPALTNPSSSSTTEQVATTHNTPPNDNTSQPNKSTMRRSNINSILDAETPEQFQTVFEKVLQSHKSQLDKHITMIQTDQRKHNDQMLKHFTALETSFGSISDKILDLMQAKDKHATLADFSKTVLDLLQDIQSTTNKLYKCSLPPDHPDFTAPPGINQKESTPSIPSTKSTNDPTPEPSPPPTPTNPARPPSWYETPCTTDEIAELMAEEKAKEPTIREMLQRPSSTVSATKTVHITSQYAVIHRHNFDEVLQTIQEFGISIRKVLESYEFPQTDDVFNPTDLKSLWLAILNHKWWIIWRDFRYLRHILFPHIYGPLPNRFCYILDQEERQMKYSDLGGIGNITYSDRAIQVTRCIRDIEYNNTTRRQPLEYRMNNPDSHTTKEEQSLRLQMLQLFPTKSEYKAILEHSRINENIWWDDWSERQFTRHTDYSDVFDKLPDKPLSSIHYRKKYMMSIGEGGSGMFDFRTEPHHFDCDGNIVFDADLSFYDTDTEEEDQEPFDILQHSTDHDKLWQANSPSLLKDSEKDRLRLQLSNSTQKSLYQVSSTPNTYNQTPTTSTTTPQSQSKSTSPTPNEAIDKHSPPTSTTHTTDTSPSTTSESSSPSIQTMSTLNTPPPHTSTVFSFKPTLSPQNSTPTQPPDDSISITTTDTSSTNPLLYKPVFATSKTNQATKADHYELVKPTTSTSTTDLSTSPSTSSSSTSLTSPSSTSTSTSPLSSSTSISPSSTSSSDKSSTTSTFSPDSLTSETTTQTITNISSKHSPTPLSTSTTVIKKETSSSTLTQTHSSTKPTPKRSNIGTSNYTPIDLFNDDSSYDSSSSVTSTKSAPSPSTIVTSTNNTITTPKQRRKSSRIRQRESQHEFDDDIRHSAKKPISSKKKTPPSITQAKQHMPSTIPSFFSPTTTRSKTRSRRTLKIVKSNLRGRLHKDD